MPIESFYRTERNAALYQQYLNWKSKGEALVEELKGYDDTPVDKDQKPDQVQLDNVRISGNFNASTELDGYFRSQQGEGTYSASVKKKQVKSFVPDAVEHYCVSNSPDKFTVSRFEGDERVGMFRVDKESGQLIYREGKNTSGDIVRPSGVEPMNPKLPKLPEPPPPPVEQVVYTEPYLQDSPIFQSSEALVERPVQTDGELKPGESRKYEIPKGSKILEEHVTLKTGVGVIGKDDTVQVVLADGEKDQSYSLNDAWLYLPERTESPASLEDLDLKDSAWDNISKLEGSMAVAVDGGDRQLVLADGSTVYYVSKNSFKTTDRGRFMDCFVVTPDGKAEAVDYRKAWYTRTEKAVFYPDPDGFSGTGNETRNVRVLGMKYDRVPAKVTENGTLLAEFDGSYLEARPIIPLDKLRSHSEGK